MKSARFKGLFLASTAFSLGIAVPAIAQEAAPEEIVVTARRIEERLQDVPLSVSVFNEKQLESHDISTGEDLARYTPSLATINRFGADRASFSIRGFDQETGTSPTVGVYFADVVAPRSASILIPGGDGAGPGYFYDLQNVQVLKGPQGTLFGINTTGGAIMLVPQKPTSQFEGYVQAGFGNYQLHEVQAVLNIPVNDKIKLRFSLDHKDRAGYLINESGIGPHDFDDMNYTALRASAVINITDDLENYTIFSYVNSDSNGFSTKLTGSSLNTPSSALLGLLYGAPAAAEIAREQARGFGFYDFEQVLPNAESEFQQWQLINTTTWNATDNITIKNIASYGELTSFLVTPLIGSNFNTGDSPLIPAAFNPKIPFTFFEIEGDPSVGTAAQSTATEEFRVQGDYPSLGLTWQTGAYLEYSSPLGYVGDEAPINSSCANYAMPLSSCTTIFSGTVSQNYGEAWYRDEGLYAQATKDIIDGLKLTAGYRYTWDEQQWNTQAKSWPILTYPARGIGTMTCAFPGSNLGSNCQRQLTDQSNKPTWVVDLEYSPIEDYLFYGRYARGYRSGGVNPGVAPPFTSFKSESLDNYELGIKSAFHGLVSGTANVAAFYNNLSGAQLQETFIPPAGSPLAPTAAPINAGEARIRGIDASLNLRPYEGVLLTADYTYLDTKILSIQDFSGLGGGEYIIQGQYAAGQPLPYSPKNKLILGASYTLPVDAKLGKITLGATFTHTGAQEVQPGDELVPSASIQAAAWLKPTNLLDLSMTWVGVMNSPFDLSAFATNVTNVKYYTFSDGAGPDGAEFQAVAPPTMYGVRVKYSFGE